MEFPRLGLRPCQRKEVGEDHPHQPAIETSLEGPFFTKVQDGPKTTTASAPRSAKVIESELHTPPTA